MKLSTSRHCLSGCDWVRLGVGVAIRRWSWGMMFGFSVGVAGVDQLRCDAMRSDPIRNGVVSVSSTSCLMTMGQRTTDNGQWDSGTLDDHTIMHTQCGSYFNGDEAHLMRKHNEIHFAQETKADFVAARAEQTIAQSLDLFPGCCCCTCCCCCCCSSSSNGTR